MSVSPSNWLFHFCAQSSERMQKRESTYFFFPPVEFKLGKQGALKLSTLYYKNKQTNK